MMMMMIIIIQYFYCAHYRPWVQFTVGLHWLAYRNRKVTIK